MFGDSLAPVTRKTLSTPDGQLSYEVTGAGPAVLAIQGVGVIEFPDASHALPIQCALEVNALLLRHLTTAEPC